MKKIILIILGCLLVINALVLAFATNFNTGIVLVFLGGVFLIFLGNFYDRLMGNKIFKYSLYFCGGIVIAMISFLLIYGSNYTATYKEDVAIILGAGIRGYEVSNALKARLDKGIEFHKKNPQAYIIVSGGQGNGELTTEANAMEKYLVLNGVNKDIIIKENKATSTYENLYFSKIILDDIFKNSYNVVIITNDFHLFRAKMLSKKIGINSNLIGSKIDWYTYPLTYLREILAIFKMAIIK